VAPGSDQNDLPDVSLWNPTPGVRGERTRRPGVLVVDDERCVRDVLGAWLRVEGFAVWLAASGREALALYGQHGGEIDAVMLDVRMPGLDGPQTLAALRELTPGVRACFLTGGFSPYTESQLREAGASAVLHKPARLDELAQVVRHLAEHAPTP
jgi:CheY-like chemotaxis protein